MQKKHSGGADVIARLYPAVMHRNQNDRILLNIVDYFKNNAIFDQMTIPISATVKKDKPSSEHSTQLFGNLIVKRLSEIDAKADRSRCIRQAYSKKSIDAIIRTLISYRVSVCVYHIIT